jgi:hypothetical protein
MLGTCEGSSRGGDVFVCALRSDVTFRGPTAIIGIRSFHTGNTAKVFIPSLLSHAHRALRLKKRRPNRSATSSTSEQRVFWPWPPWQCFLCRRIARCTYRRRQSGLHRAAACAARANARSAEELGILLTPVVDQSTAIRTRVFVVKSTPPYALQISLHLRQNELTFVFIFLRIAFPVTPLFSQPSALSGVSTSACP